MLEHDTNQFDLIRLLSSSRQLHFIAGAEHAILPIFCPVGGVRVYVLTFSGSDADHLTKVNKFCLELTRINEDFHTYDNVRRK